MSQRHRDADLPVPAKQELRRMPRRAASHPCRAVQRAPQQSAPESIRPTCTSPGQRGSLSTTATPTWRGASCSTALADGDTGS